MSQAAVSEDLLSILRKFTSPRMGPFDSTNTPAPQPPPQSIASAAPPPPGNFNSGNEQQSPLPPPMALPGMPPQPVSRRVVPSEGSPADAPAPGAEEVAFKPPPPSVAAAEPGTPDWLANNPVYGTWLAQQNRLRQEAREAQGNALIASGFGDIAGAFGAKVSGGGGGGAGGAPGSSLASGSSALTLEQMAGFKGAADEAIASAQDSQRIKRIVADPRMKGVSEDVLLTLKKNNPAKFADLVADYFNGESDTFTDSDGSIWSRPKRGEPGAKPTLILSDPSKAEKEFIERRKGAQTLIDPKLQSDDNLRAIAKILNRPDDPASLDVLRRMSADELQKQIGTVTTAAATGSGGPRGWVNKEIEAKAGARTKLGESFRQLPQMEHLVSLLDDPNFRGNTVAGDTLNRFYREIGGITGADPALPKDQFDSSVQGLVQSVIKQYGTNASDRDLKAALATFGSGTTGETARAQLAIVAMSKVWEARAHNADIDDRVANAGLTASEKEQANAQKIAMPKVTPQLLHIMNIEPKEVELLRSKIGTPQEDAARTLFRQEHGDIGDWALGETK